MNTEITIALLLGIGLSASSGFRVFIPLLVASVASYFDVLHLGQGFDWLGSVPSMIVFGVAAVVEVIAYYIPVVDNFLDTIATPLAIGAGALLTTAVLPIDENLSRWAMGIIIGGGSAASIQTGTSLLRLFSTKATLTTANPIVSTTENVSATTSSILALFFPVLIGIIFLIIIGYVLFRMAKWRQSKNSSS
ncbi:MAG: DUF4126 domain-containing protein [Bacteroidia bacterium]|nr:MAG: DUF4126 domain-containing protein [Bacteroidia bacterium]